MIDRILILAIVVVAVAAVWSVIQLWSKIKIQQLQKGTPLSAIIPTGKPAVVSFSTPSCRDCRTLQAPALARLKAGLHDRVTILSLSALEHPDLVDTLGILTVPSTVVVDAKGAIKALNLGYASDAKLIEQLNMTTA